MSGYGLDSIMDLGYCSYMWPRVILVLESDYFLVLKPLFEETGTLIRARQTQGTSVGSMEHMVARRR